MPVLHYLRSALFSCHLWQVFLVFSCPENKAQWASHGGNSEISVIIRISGKLGVPCAARTPSLGEKNNPYMFQC
jgi:hypothetical protein